MRNRRIPPYLIPAATFFAAGVAYALFRGTFTLKGFLVGLVAVAVIVVAATQMNRGPYI